jgi:hypothetical protein
VGLEQYDDCHRFRRRCDRHRYFGRQWYIYYHRLIEWPYERPGHDYSVRLLIEGKSQISDSTTSSRVMMTSPHVNPNRSQPWASRSVRICWSTL